MLKRAGLIQACVLGTALNATALFAGNAFAQQGCCEGGDATGANAWTEGNATSAQWPPNPPPPNIVTLPVKAPPPTPVPYWWTHGEIEFGGRGFVNDPNQSGSIYADTNRNNKTNGGYAYVGQKSLGKFYEYGIESPNPFGGGHVAAGTSDGLYQIDLWANNIASNFHGFSDQSYLLQASKAGEHYFWFSWDQTPHIYSTSALTPFLGVGSDNLVWPGGKITSVPGILPFLQPVDLGIKRDTASAGYRWTPPDWSRPEGYAWDVRADYSYMTRKGTQAAGIVELNGFQPTEVPGPVDDNTQNFGANGEYAGTAPWGGKYTFKVAYNGSVYHDNMSSYTVQNPFFPTLGSCASTTPNCVSAQLSTPPSNSANGGSATATAELPWSSRYAGTFSYVRMEQDDSFIPMTNNPLAQASPLPGFGGIPWSQVNFGFINGNLGQPTSSLNGQINEILSNNVLTTKITPELTQKLTYRFYEFDNDTPRIVFPAWIGYDRVGSPDPKDCLTTHLNECTISSLTISYIKQDAGYDLNWRPSPEWNFNAAGGWERYNYTQTDVDGTNEFSGKASVDWKPTVWLTARASGYYSDRRYDTYSYNTFVRPVQFPAIPPFGANTSASWFYAPAYQQFMFDNRERTKVNLALDVVAFRGVTISPTFKYQDDFYGLNPANQMGVTDSRITSWGVDLGWVVTPDLSFAASYYWEYYDQSLYNYTNTATGFPWEAQPGTCAQPPTSPQGNCLLTTSDKQHVNTVTAAMNYAAIPGKLDFDLRYTISWGVDEQKLLLSPTTTGCTNCFNVFPNDTTLFERLDAVATYKFDPDWVRSMGFNGDLKAKLRYTWERNGVNNWQNDPLAPFTNITGLTNAIWLAYQNPNYNVQMIAGSLIASW